MPKPYIRRPKRWLFIGAMLVVVIVAEVLLSSIWPNWGPFLLLPLAAGAICLRILWLRREYRRNGVPPELTAWMEERAQKRRP